MRTNNIKQVRERLGLSQASFAEAIGVSQGNISHYECQRQNVSPDVARRVIAAAHKLGVVITFDDVYAPTAEAKAPIEPPKTVVIPVVTPERRADERRGSKG